MARVRAIVYGLHSGDGVIRYVGCTTQGLEKRVSDHMGETRLWVKRGKPLSAKHLWIMEVLEQEGRVQGVILFSGTQRQAQAMELKIQRQFTNLTNSPHQEGRTGKPVGTTDSEATILKKKAAWAATYEERRVALSIAGKGWRQRRPEEAREHALRFARSSMEWRRDPENNAKFRATCSRAHKERWDSMSPEERAEALKKIQLDGSKGGRTSGINRRRRLGYPFPELPMSHPSNLAWHLSRKKSR